jgi:hypothetical protein
MEALEHADMQSSSGRNINAAITKRIQTDNTIPMRTAYDRTVLDIAGEKGIAHKNQEDAHA